MRLFSIKQRCKQFLQREAVDFLRGFPVENPMENDGVPRLAHIERSVTVKAKQKLCILLQGAHPETDAD